MNSPFKLLDAFTLEDKDSFFGRDQEIEALYNMVFQSRLILIYGRSGTGKTSLVRCGLASKFDGPDWLPIYIRRYENINESLLSSLNDKFDGDINSDPVESTNAIFNQSLRPIYLIFDQFEELFIYGSDHEKATFIGHVKALYQANISCRILLIMREEYLGHLYHFEKSIPGLYDHSLRVEPITVKKMMIILKSSFEKFNITLPMAGEQGYQLIIDKISQGRSGIQLPFVQVYLDMLYKIDYRRTYPNVDPDEEFPPLEITREEIHAFGGIDDVLPEFLSNQLRRIQKIISDNDPNLPDDIVSQVLDGFVSHDGTKRPLRFNTIEDSNQIAVHEADTEFIPNLSSKILTECLNQLERSRLIRSDKDYYELAHDTLAELIERQRTTDQRLKHEVRQRIHNAHIEYEQTGQYLSQRQLDSFQRVLPTMQLGADLIEFVDRSKENAEAEDLKEKWRRDEELRKTQALLHTQTQAAERQSVFTRWILAVAVLAILMGIYGVWTRNNLLQTEKEKAFEVAMKDCNIDKNNGNYSRALDRLESIRQNGNALHTSQADSMILLLKKLDLLTTAAEQKNRQAIDEKVDQEVLLASALVLYDSAYRIDLSDQLLQNKKNQLAVTINNKFLELLKKAEGLAKYREYGQAARHLEMATNLIPKDISLLPTIFPNYSAEQRSDLLRSLEEDIGEYRQLVSDLH